jgi:hypothetical protein
MLGKDHEQDAQNSKPVGYDASGKLKGSGRVDENLGEYNLSSKLG